MKISKTKTRIELRRTIENLKNSGLSYEQTICIVSVINAFNNIFESFENPEERVNLIEKVINEVFEISE
jgi:hypothetical protein